ncbi:iron ABC transporter permease [Edwardsiella ictaluri]|uniref:Iron ABC transporter permease n=1 Tax=Edwardsiella ictaluri TaxID=67780 RepID=A0ABY8GHT0_EDWIC|nr:iron ABC transporter permease [Edwardsiella ictaluri]ELV7527914.1 iron ABC transporter permease [Edwardsiella ictaluri]KMQ78282.1 iron ABC transporter permease [Edwardsiella ictaluri]KOO55106.1 iron ABC transporter permease [Edwardsiella ictaluri]WFN97077.1 iron ABC transporter permease [Edwardsiella ictaluri]
MASISKTSPPRGRFLPRPTPLALSAIAVALLAVTPLLSLLWLAADGGVQHWRDLWRYVLPQAALNTLLLLAGVALLAGTIGVGCAWAVSAFQFPGRRLLSWGLLLPLAMPTYIVAFSWLDLLHPIGPLQSVLRLLLGYDSPRQFRLPDIRGAAGAIVLFSLVLYPYIYLTMRAMFISQPAHLLEAARTLGENGRGTFLRVVLPMARPALAVGISLALLETLNDLGASEFLGVQTLTVAVYTTWITRSDIAAAAQIACMMLGFIFLLLTLELYGRRRQRYAGRGLRTLQPQPLRGARAWLLSAATALPLLLGFIIPLLHLIWQSLKRLESQTLLSAGLLAALRNTLLLALGVTLLAVAISLALSWYARIRALAPPTPPLRRITLRLASLGYAVPGTILAIGFMPPALRADAWLATVLEIRGLPLFSCGLLLILCCTLRFQTITLGALDAGLSRIAPSLEQAARSLGEREGATFWRVHLPLLRPAMIGSALLLFADVMKELPITLLLRPVNVETLATLLYAEAARGTYEDGATAALLIVLVGTLPMTLLVRSQLKHAGESQ